MQNKTLKKHENSTDGKLPSDVIEVLIKVSQAYQGIGDFESTGQNMVSVIEDVRKVLTNYGIDWRN